MASGDDLPRSTIELIRIKFPFSKVYIAYGLTEIGGRGCIFEANADAKLGGSVGKPIRGLDVSIKDQNNSKLGSNEIGVIYFSGSYLLKGYLRGSGEIEAFDEAAEFSTGDVGYIDEYGDLFLLGRSDDVFKVAGKKVSGLAIRRAILESGLVDDAAVYAVDDPRMATVVVAVVIPRNNEGHTKQALLKYLRGCLPVDHIPREVISVEKIPRTASGKIQRKSLLTLVNDLKAVN
ncbi:ANL family adenylate-forming protein [Cellvibrio sp.]|uniref:ANL family adenylate-forming protein n=1 Tax=Cellvibrio sp. TaxID=1965322 RepID=UPI0039648C67